MPLRAVLLAAVAAALVGAAGCGAPDSLDSDDDRDLATAREALDDALDTEETIRTAPEMARALVAQVRRAGDDAPAVERAVPSLVEDGEVNSEAANAFVRYAATDASRALLIPATDAVDAMTEVIDDSGADGDTEVPHADDQPMERFVGEVERDIADVWPALAQELADAL
jgi:hypothetical protein